VLADQEVLNMESQNEDNTDGSSIVRCPPFRPFTTALLTDSIEARIIAARAVREHAQCQQAVCAPNPAPALTRSP
jgi:hypothetical protein